MDTSGPGTGLLATAFIGKKDTNATATTNTSVKTIGCLTLPMIITPVASNNSLVLEWIVQLQSIT
jgi:hypothetical protein